MRILAWSAFAAAAFLSSAAGATAISALTDDFSHENHGVGVLNYTGFQNFNVTTGSVNVVGSAGFWDIYHDHSLYVDLAGSTGQFGAITSKNTFAPGHYQLEIDMGGPLYAGISDGAIISIGDKQFATGLLQGLHEYSFTFEFDLANPATLRIADAGLSGNANIGATLFSVSMVDPPLGDIGEPGVLSILGIGLVGLALTRRRIRASWAAA